MSKIRCKNRLNNKELYQSSNYFFITICTKKRGCVFGEVVVGESPAFPSTNLNIFGKLAEEEWKKIPDIYGNVFIDSFTMMPNHIHSIIGFNGSPYSKMNQKVVNLSIIISSFKSISYKKIKAFAFDEATQSTQSTQSTQGDWESPLLEDDSTGYKESRSKKTILNLIKMHNTIWQKSFYDHIIRDDRDLHRIQKYILYNPLKWSLDILNPRNSERYQSWIERKTLKGI